jgi:hypothetical protein
VAGAAKAAHALRPGGRLAVFWNSFRPPADVDKALAEVWFRVFGSPFSLATLAGPGAYSAMCTKAADGMRQASAFGDSEEWRFDWDRPYTRDEWLDLVPTAGGSGQLPADSLISSSRASGPPSTRWGADSPCTTARWRSPRR